MGKKPERGKPFALGNQSAQKSKIFGVKENKVFHEFPAPRKPKVFVGKRFYPKKNIKGIIFLIVVFVLLIIAFSPPAVALWKSFALIGNIFLQEEYRPLKNIEIEKVEVDYTSGGKEFVAHIYLPKSGKAGKAIIIYTPLARDGLEDENLKNAAETFAKIGITVLVPIEKGKKYALINEEDINDVSAAVLFLKNFTNIEKIGIFGISYGVWPVIAASADEKAKEDVSFMLLLGGYYDLKNLVKSTLTGSFEYGGLSGEFESDPYVKEILQISFIGFAKEADQPFLRSALDGGTSSLGELSDGGLAIYNLLSNTDKEKFEGLFTALSPELKAKLERLSTKNYISGISPGTKIFLLHSPSDTYIPYTESMRIYDSLSDAQKKNARISIIGTFGHSIPEEITLENLFSVYMPAFKDLLAVVYDIVAD